jgi:predicted Na+-dependent transporter
LENNFLTIKPAASRRWICSVALVDVALLAVGIAILTFASRQLGFSRADEITIVFCGSRKASTAACR